MSDKNAFCSLKTTFCAATAASVIVNSSTDLTVTSHGCVSVTASNVNRKRGKKKEAFLLPVFTGSSQAMAQACLFINAVC